MKYNIRPTTKFQKDLKRVQRRGYDLSLLIYEVSDGDLILYLTRTGTHSDLL